MNNKCPKCGNEDVKKFYVVGETPEKGEKFCDKCVNDREDIVGAKNNG